MDCEHEFELPHKIAGTAVSTVSGRADLVWDEGYNFYVAGIELDTEDGDVILLNERSDDPEIVKAFRDISAQLHEDKDAQEDFAAALAEYRLGYAA